MSRQKSFFCGRKVRLTCAGWLALGVMACAENQEMSGEPASQEGPSELASSQQNLWAIRSSLWAPSYVSVCFEPTGNTLSGTALSDAQGWIRNAAEQTWQAQSRVTFAGWGTCQPNSPGIHVVINNDHSHTVAIGNQLSGTMSGMVISTYLPLVTFSDGTQGCGWGAFGEQLVGTQQQCVFWTAVHEFGHAIGFPHEQNRPDHLATCTFQVPGETPGDWNVSAYDTNSVMNYCNPLWNGHGQLSPGDISGVRTAYGPAPAATPTNAHVAVVRQNSTNTTAVSVGADGAMYLRWVYQTQAWNPGLAISGSNFAPAGAPVAMAFQGANQVDAFVIGNDGRLYVTAAANGGAWAAPVALTGANFAPAGARIAVGTQGGNQLDVFVVGGNGAVQMLSVVGTGAWTTPRAITAANVATPGAALATGMQGTNQLDVFFVGTDGAIKAMAATGTSTTWFGPFVLSPTNMFASGAYLATGTQAGTQLDVFAAGKDGAIKAIWVVGLGAWNGPLALSATGLVPSGASLSTAPFGTNQLDVFFVDNSGTVKALWVVGQGAWQGPLALSAAGVAQAGAKTAAASQYTGTSTPQLDLIIAGSSGLLLQSGLGSNPWTTPVSLR